MREGARVAVQTVRPNALSRDPEHARGFMERDRDRLVFGRGYRCAEHLQFRASPGRAPAVLAGNALRLVPLN